MVWNWLRRHSTLVDVTLALLLGAAYIAHAAHRGDWDGGVPLAVAQALPLILRRRYPRTVLGVITTAWIAQVAFASALPPIPTMVAVYTVGANLERAEGLRAAAVATVATSIATLGIGNYGGTLSDLVLLVGAWVVGDNLGTRRAYTRALEERAERLEREREAEAARARAEEQARIARELHDVIAH
ncbi:MAG TPA: hypothetical protein VGN06_13295, partial [Gaiellaceae bacterium]